MHNMLQAKRGKNDPFLIIAIDEAHSLTPIQKGERGDWRPSIVFCRAIADFSTTIPPQSKYWVVFASTTSKVADFAAPRVKCKV